MQIFVLKQTNTLIYLSTTITVGFNGEQTFRKTYEYVSPSIAKKKFKAYVKQCVDDILGGKSIELRRCCTKEEVANGLGGYIYKEFNMVDLMDKNLNFCEYLICPEEKLRYYRF